MAEEISEYAGFFQVNLRVEIGITVAHDETFRDWAIIKDFHDDLIEVELSRDQLPRRVKINYGSILDVGVWRGDEVYTSRGIVVQKVGEKILNMRLLGAVTLRDRRQFYRLNVRMRLRYSLPDPRLSAAELRFEWEEAWQREMESFRVRSGEYDVVAGNVLLRRKGTAQPEPVWYDRQEIRAVIGGGGIGFRMHRQMQPGDMVRLELHLSLYPFRVVHAVAEVIHILEPVRLPGSSDQIYYTGMQFHHIDERDRDHIFEYISQSELERLRVISERRLPEIDETRLELNEKQAHRREKLLNLLFLVMFLATVYFVTRYVIAYKSTHHDNDIGRDFRKSFSN